MKKPSPNKRIAIKQLRVCIRESRKLARQINRKLESLAQWNKVKTAAQEALIKLCESK
jgi:hypothetical protein